MGYLVIAEIDSIDDMTDLMKERRTSISLGEPMWYMDIEKYLVINKLGVSKIRERRPRDQNERTELDWIVVTPFGDGFHYEKQPLNKRFNNKALILCDVQKTVRKKTFEYFGYINFTFQEISDKSYMLLDSYSELDNITDLKKEFRKNFGITELIKYKPKRNLFFGKYKPNFYI